MLSGNIHPSEIAIRPFVSKDQSSVKSLVLSGLKEHWGALDLSKNPDLNHIEETYERGLFLVAVKGLQMLGTGAYLPRSDDTVEIVRMSVHPSVRRLGIGWQILDALCSEAKTRGFAFAILETCNNWLPAINFYLKYGFLITGTDEIDTYFRKPL